MVAHEATLVHEANALKSWCSKFSTEVPAKLVKWFSTSLTLKSSTSAVRTAYINCMMATFNGLYMDIIGIEMFMSIGACGLNLFALDF